MTKEQIKKNNKEEKKVTLSDFVDENRNLITVLGVFTALTVFANNLEINYFGNLLSFLFMTLAILVWIELWIKFPSHSGSLRLIWFENILLITVLVLIGYWLTDYRSIWKQGLFVLIFGIISSIFSWIIKKSDIFNRLFKTESGKKSFLRYVVAFITIGIIVFGSMYLANLISPPINIVLDEFRDSLFTPTP